MSVKDLLCYRFPFGAEVECWFLTQEISGFSTAIPFLPPASEGWGKILFSVYLSVHTSTGGEGTWSGLDGGGGYPSQVWMVGGGYPGQVLMVGGTLARS